MMTPTSSSMLTHAKHCMNLSVAIRLPKLLINLSARFRLSSTLITSSSILRICSRCLRSSSIVASPTCFDAETMFLVFMMDDFVLSCMSFISLIIMLPASSPDISPRTLVWSPRAPTNSSPRCWFPLRAFISLAHCDSCSDSLFNLFSNICFCLGSGTRRVSILYDFLVPWAALSFFSARSSADALSRSPPELALSSSDRIDCISSLSVSSQY
mmetsp:Transcript_12560/g.29669  ORF Transcript_12560/g.29669 Transcript_12560/m.29669 type:complete len:213 (+) Transcript_12560:164-802(+)